MRRRGFLVRVGSAVLGWHFSALAQRPAILSIGFLNSGAPNERAHLVDAFRRGLKEGGYVDGQDVAIEYRWAEGRFERLPSLATELVSRRVAVIAATGHESTALAAKSATSTIPIVFTGGWDPIKLGLVVSLGRPGGNVTGVLNRGRSLDAKRLEILHELAPSAIKIAYIFNPARREAGSDIEEVQRAAKATRTNLLVQYVRNDGEIESSFAAIKANRANAILVASDSLFITRRDQIVSLAARYGLPGCYPFREFVATGGLMSYGPDLADGYRQAGSYAARILKGAKPSELPVIQSDKFELVVNRKTAQKLGLHLSRDFLARIDELID